MFVKKRVFSSDFCTFARTICTVGIDKCYQKRIFTKRNRTKNENVFLIALTAIVLFSPRFIGASIVCSVRVTTVGITSLARHAV